MRNAMNIYKRKDGRFEGRIPLGYDDKGRIKYKYLYSKSLSELKEKCFVPTHAVLHKAPVIKPLRSCAVSGLRPRSCA